MSLLFRSFASTTKQDIAQQAHGSKSLMVIKSGYLQKKSKTVKRAKKRWIVLTDVTLISFKDDNTKRKPTETFDLRIYCRLKVTNKTEFELLTQADHNKHSRVFIAKTPEELMEWIAVIGDIQKKLVY